MPDPESQEYISGLTAEETTESPKIAALADDIANAAQAEIARGLYSDEALDRRFTYRAPAGDQVIRYQRIRTKCRSLAGTLIRMCPGSRELSLSLNALDQVMFLANAAIARTEGKDQAIEVADQLADVKSETMEADADTRPTV